MPLTEKGFEALRANDFLTLIRTDYEDRTGLDIDFEFDVFLGNFTAIVADRLGELSELLQAIYDQKNANNAIGVQLSDLAVVTGARRREATFSTVAMTLTGVAATFIPAGHTVEGGGDNDSARWDLVSDVTLDGGGLFVGAIYQAQVAGAVAAGPGGVDAIVTAVSGLETVTNPASASTGLDRETDDQLRTRRLDLLQLAGSSSAAAIKAQVLAVDAVTAAVVIENDTDDTITVEGVTVDPRSVGTVVHPPTLTDDEKIEVAEAIYLSVCASIGTSGAEVAIVTGRDLAPKTIRFGLSTTLDVTTTFNVTREVGNDVPTIDEIREELIAATADLFAALSLGEDVRILPVTCLADPVEGVRSATVFFTVTDVSRIQPSGDVSIFNNELAVSVAVPPFLDAVRVLEV